MGVIHKGYGINMLREYYLHHSYMHLFLLHGPAEYLGNKLNSYSPCDDFAKYDAPNHIPPQLFDLAEIL